MAVLDAPKLSEEQLRMLGTIDRGADLGWGRIHGREWFGTAFRDGAPA